MKKYLGMVILPHSGVSLVLTGIAISALSGSYSQYGDIVRGTIAAAAVINEVIAVFVAASGWLERWNKLPQAEHKFFHFLNGFFFANRIISEAGNGYQT